MAVSFVGSATSTTDTVTIPAHQVGDVIIILGFRDGSNGTPTVPGDFTTLETVTTNSAGSALAYKIADTTTETSGTWSLASEMTCHVYRGCTVGDSAVATGNSTTVSYPALTLTVGDGTSWVAGFACHRSTNTALETPPTGMTNRSTFVDTGEVAGHDTDGGVASWSNQNVAVGGTGSGWGGFTVELVADSGAQNLTPSLFTNNQTFHAATVGRGAVGLTPSLFTNAQTFFAPKVNHGLRPALFTNNQTFFSPTVTNGGDPQTLTPSLFTNDQTFFGPTVSSTYALAPDLFTNVTVFFAAEISAQRDTGAGAHKKRNDRRSIYEELEAEGFFDEPEVPSSPPVPAALEAPVPAQPPTPIPLSAFYGPYLAMRRAQAEQAFRKLQEEIAREDDDISAILLSGSL